MVSIIFEVMDTTLLDTEKPGSRKGRPNHSPEFRRRIAIAACEPSVSVANEAGHRSATNQTRNRKTGRTRWHD
ncbi:MAG: hypothetical protein VB142_09010 [Burkholderia sp.]